MADELQNIISGKSQVRHGAIIKAAASYLGGSAQASSMAKRSKHIKKQETKTLEKFVTE
jgi:hypothetical protein